MKRKTKTRIIAAIFTIFFIGMFFAGYRLSYNKMPEKINPANAEENITVCTRVVDGDTIVISGGDKVRLIGIYTPEVHTSNKLYRDAERTGRDIRTIQALGKQASDYAKRELEGKQIKLEFDPNNKHINHRDKYGRLLAYVYVWLGKGYEYIACPHYDITEERDDGIYLFFNATIINTGHAHAYTRFPFKYMDEFRRYEREAREHHRGLWAGEDFQ